MNNFKCLNCGREFDEPLHIHDREVADYGIGREWITVFEGDVCPFCESMVFEEMSDEDDDVAEQD